MRAQYSRCGAWLLLFLSHRRAIVDGILMRLWSIRQGSAMVAVATKSDASAYFPAAGAAWQSVAPRDAGFDAGKLTEAIAFANAHECAWPYSMYLDNGEYVGTAFVEEKPPYNTVIGEVRPRGGVNGLI